MLITRRARSWSLAALVLVSMASTAQAAERWVSIGADGNAVVETTMVAEAPRVSVLRADPGGVSALIVSSGFGVEAKSVEAGEFLELRWPGASLAGEIGSPAMPVVRRLFIAPTGAEVSLRVLESPGVTVNLEAARLPWRVMPVQPPVEKVPGALEQAVFQLDQAAYGGASHLLTERASVQELGIVRGQRLFLLEIRPVAYHTAFRTLTFYPDLRAQVTFKGGSLDPSPMSTMPGLAEQVLNPEQITTNSDNGGNYLIVVDAAYETDIAAFAAAKTGQGFSVSTHVVDGDTNSAIKTYIEGLWGTANAPEYILLVGDTDTIPHWTGGGEGTPATDLPYACMDGASDWYPDIAIGRFPVRSSAQLSAIVDKTLYYEAGVYSDPDYKMRAVFMASTDNYTISEGTHNYVIDNYMDPLGYTSDKLYTVTYSATTQDVRDSFNAGRFFGVYSGHGGTTSWADGPPFSQSDVNNLTNADMYPVVFSFACVTGTYTLDECFTETWIRAENKGAVGIWGSSVNSYWTEDDILEKRLFDSIFDETDSVPPRLGPVWNDTMVRYLAEMGSGSTTRRYFEMYNLLGDPALLYLGSECTDAGRVNLNRGNYACEDSIDISVIDCNMHSDDLVAETTIVTVDSDTESGETATLTENSLTSPISEGSIVISGTDAAGVLQVSDGDTITVTYTDADDGEGGTNVPVTAQATVDCTQPVISNVQVTDIEPRTALVTFDTNEPARGSVDYGTSCGSLTMSAGGGGLSTNVAVALTGMQENTPYFFIVHATDEAGNSSTDDNGGMCYTFTTPDIPDFFTEQFDSDNDLDFHILTFQPNGSVDFYGGCQDPIVAFPTDPAGGTEVTLSDDGNALVTLTGETVSLYGVSYDSFYIGANGYITFTAGDGDYTETLDDHFDLPRISALFDDLSPQNNDGVVSWKQLPDRVAVTYENVPEYSTSNINNFQIEMFFNGNITISYLDIAVSDGIAGLSEGAGLDPDFYETDLESMPSCGGAPCLDGVLGEGEERIDCGGPCPPCDCLTDGECEDGLYCTGTESCNEYGVCVTTGDPCAGGGQYCKESNLSCVDCLTDSHCDDGLFCTGVERCHWDNSCASGPAPCPWTTCNDSSDTCIICDNDGICEPAEDCYNCPNDCTLGTATQCGNSICETADGEDCLTCPDDCNGLQTGLLSFQYCCGDGSGGNNPVTCSDSRCTADGNTCSTTTILLYCCGDGTCEDVESMSNCPADCTPVVPGEAGGGTWLMVEGFDRATGLMSISYGVPCAAADHTIRYGELSRANLESYSWGGEECHLGMSGIYDWPTTGTPDAIFFVVVADNGMEEGSYGQSSYGFERLEDTASATCQYDQNLQYACE